MAYAVVDWCYWSQSEGRLEPRKVGIRPHPRLAVQRNVPHRLIGNHPGFFYETCLVGWGATRISDFDEEMIAE
jgi:hypothetical protein